MIILVVDYKKLKQVLCSVPTQTCMVYHMDLHQGLCCSTQNFVICFCFEDCSSDFANFANYTTPYECEPTLIKDVSNLEITTEIIFEWFSFNILKANASKCHLLLYPYQTVPVNVRGSIIESSNCKKLFPVGIYLLEVNNRNSFQPLTIVAKLSGRRSVVFIVNFEHISHLFQLFLLLTLNM